MRRPRFSIAAVAVLAGLLSAGPSAFGQAPIRAVALSGQAAPDRPAGTAFVSFEQPRINQNGLIAFVGRTRHGTDSETGIWAGSARDPRLVARDGESAPGAPSGTRYAINSLTLRMADSGALVFLATLSGPAVTPENDRAILAAENRELHMLVRSGDDAPGTESGVRFGRFDDEMLTLVNGTGRIAFMAPLVGAGVDALNDAGIWSGFPGEIQLVAREGAPIPGAPNEGPRFASDGLRQPALNEAGQVAFLSQLEGAGVSSDNDAALFFGALDALELVVRKGDHAPGLPPDALLFGFEMSAVTALSGEWQYAFSANNGFALPAARRGIWIGSVNHSLGLVVADRQPAPSDDAGREFMFFDPPVMSRRATVAFGAVLTDPNPPAISSIWTWTAGSATLIVRARQHAPGTPDGVIFDQVYGATLAVNTRGQVAFRGRVAGPSVTSWNADGLWLSDAHGRPRLVARTGEPIRVAPGDTRWIQDLDLPHALGSQNTGQLVLSDRGQFVFWARFTDASEGLFIATVGRPGDLNGDDSVDAADIDAFVLALTDGAAYQAAYPDGDVLLADVNGDSRVDNFDVDPFIALLMGG